MTCDFVNIGLVAVNLLGCVYLTCLLLRTRRLNGLLFHLCIRAWVNQSGAALQHVHPSLEGARMMIGFPRDEEMD